MSLFVVTQPTCVQSEHCREEAIHGPTGKWSTTPVIVNTRIGRMFKKIEGARALAKRVGGYVSDLNSHRVVEDYRAAGMM